MIRRLLRTRSLFLGVALLVLIPLRGVLPNVVVFLADDLGYGDLGCYGAEDLRTPAIDQLARQGVRFTQFYSNGPECTPTRVALLTGRYQQRAGGLECAIGAGNVGRYDEAEWLQKKKSLGLPPGESTLLHALKAANYRTALLGKWHLGYERELRPDRHGFDYSFGPIGYGGDYFYHVEQVDNDQTDLSGAHNLAENGQEIFRDGEYLTKLITSKAVWWLDSQTKEQPFFLYVPYTAPHSPYQGPEDDLGRPLRGNDEWNFRSRAKLIEMTEAMDESVGEILDALDRKGLAEETLVVFASDNGGTRIANNGVLSGNKGQVYEGGIRVPCIIRWPEHVPSNRIVSQTSITFDLTASILALAKTTVQGERLDGYDIVDHVVQAKSDFDRSLYWRAKRGTRVRKAIREGDLKYRAVYEDGELSDVGLYDLLTDIAEKTNLIARYPEKADTLRSKLEKWEASVAAVRLEPYYTTSKQN